MTNPLYPYCSLAFLFLFVFPEMANGQGEPIFISGVNPQLAHTNFEGEVGIGAVVPWAGSLWTNTYGPHLPHGSTDKLRQIDSDWNMIEHPQSVGGTPANRMIHRESNQLLMGHHLIDAQGKVRTIDPKADMPGRITANARHLTDPKNKVYYLTMENGIYEVDIHTLEVTNIVRDPLDISKTHLPGYHGKGAYTGSGRVVVSNNGEPTITSPSGCLATWDGKDWTIVARNQFVEVTGPGGLSGNTADDDRVWATGWDEKSVRLLVFEDGRWSKFRLPKGSYTHDAFHGWNTEWPRIRQVKKGLTLMHMHGLFFEFPQTFSKTNYGGLRPISTYVKMPVDYAWFNNKLVIAKDDASMFHNDFVRQSQSNLWVGDFEELSQWGPKSGFGGVWLHDRFDAGEISEPFFIAGFQHGALHLSHRGGFDCLVQIQIDRNGTGNWEAFKSVMVSGTSGYLPVVFSMPETQWVRLIAKDAADDMTAYFHLTTSSAQRNSDDRFAGLVPVTNEAPTGATLQLPRGKEMKLNVFTLDQQFQVDGELKATPVEMTAADQELRNRIAIVSDKRVGCDQASAFIKHEDRSGKKVTLRLPKGHSAFDATVGNVRHIREIVTERTTMNLHGTFYEIPRPEANGFLNFRQMKPISSHNRHINDFCSWRGLLVFSGAKHDHEAQNHVRAGTAGLWLGEADDLWKLGKPTGSGGPWLNTQVEPNVPSDPYLMLGYDRKTLNLSHDSEVPVEFTIEVDFLGTGEFAKYARFTAAPHQPFVHQFEDGFAAHWVRVVSDTAMRATARFDYE